MRILLINPPLTQLNTPYPAISYLKAFLKERNQEVFQIDLGIDLICNIFSESGLKKLFEFAASKKNSFSPNSKRIFSLKTEYILKINQVVGFLQNKNHTPAYSLSNPDFYPQANRFKVLSQIDECVFGRASVTDKAKFLATLFIEDLGDFITENISQYFGFSRYAEKLGIAANSFDTLENELQTPPDYIDEIYLSILKEKTEPFNPELVGISIPFHGSLFGALRCGQFLKDNFPHLKIVMGGGYVSTELRSIQEPRFFKYTDFLIPDDGETPLIQLIDCLENNKSLQNLKRCFYLQNNEVVKIESPALPEIKFSETGYPDYSDLQLDNYISVLEIANPMHRLWTDGRWNKMTLAHGCYWHKCTFCDTSLSYIKDFEAQPVNNIIERIKRIVAETGETGFHFVDEAAPPALLKQLSIELIRQKISITWWTNVRFEKNFSAGLCKLMAEAGCIAVSGGLEVASDRILKRINKGVTIKQATQVTRNFTEAGIMVHTYLMYGFPGQTVQETIDSLEVVRQLFENGLVASAYWHLYTMTAHSETGMFPEKFDAKIVNKNKGDFANNDLQHIDLKGARHTDFGEGLRKATYNFLHGVGFEFAPNFWFDFKTPKTTVSRDLIRNFVNEADIYNKSQQIIWLGIVPESSAKVIETKSRTIKPEFDIDTNSFIINYLSKCSVHSENIINLEFFINELETETGIRFDNLIRTKTWKKLLKSGLIIV